MESAKLAPQPFHPVFPEIFVHPMHGVVMGTCWARQEAGRGSTLELGSGLQPHKAALVLSSHAERGA